MMMQVREHLAEYLASRGIHPTHSTQIQSNLDAPLIRSRILISFVILVIITGIGCQCMALSHNLPIHSLDPQTRKKVDASFHRYLYCVFLYIHA